MNKSELISTIAAKSGLTAVDAAKFVDAFTKTIEETLISGDKVAIAGFGGFEVREKSERQGCNPKTGEKIIISACKTPAFKAGKNFKDAVNK